MSSRATSSRSPRWPWAVGIALLLGNPAAGAAAGSPELDGSVSLAWYNTGDGSDAGLEPANADNRLLERFRLSARHLAPGVDFHTLFSVRQWFGGDRDGDSEIRFQQAYLRARASGRWSGLELVAGRHWRYGAGATGLLDGATLSYRHGIVRVEGFAGTRDWENRDDIRWPDFDRTRWLGGSVDLRPVPWGEISGGYNVLRRGEKNEREILASTVDLRPLRPFRVLAEIRFDYVRNYALDQRVRASWRPDGRREVWAEYARRRPDLDPDSFIANFLNLIDAQRDEYRGGFRFAVQEVGFQADLLTVNHHEPAQISPQFTGADLREPDQMSWDTRTRLTWRGQSVGWYHSDGFGGERDGLLVALNRKLTPKVRVGFDANALTYEYGRGQGIDEDLATLTAWAEAQVDSETWAMAEVERLNNTVDGSDVRVLLRLRRGFRIGE